MADCMGWVPDYSNGGTVYVDAQLLTAVGSCGNIPNCTLDINKSAIGAFWITGLSPGQKVTVNATITKDGIQFWKDYGYKIFTANSDGMISGALLDSGIIEFGTDWDGGHSRPKKAIQFTTPGKYQLVWGWY